MKKRHLAIINGPNLNLLGRRQVEIYGNQTFDSYYEELKEHFADLMMAYYQSNHEGDIIDKLHQIGYEVDGIVLNAGAYTHTSIAIADAVAAISAPVVEVHISNVYERESYRHHSYLTEVCAHHIIGQGLAGYSQAIDYLLTRSS